MPLAYSAWKGLPASVVTDVVQLVLILLIAFVITPWTVHSAGGLDVIIAGLGGASGEHRSLFDWDVFYSFGIAATIALLAVPLADQMFYQRAMACPKGKLLKTFILGAALFALVPIVLSLLGFVATAPSVSKLVDEPSFPKILLNVAAVREFLPEWTFIGFVVMAVCALSSTLDSALCAIGSLWAQDIYKRYLKKDSTDEENLRATRIAVIVIGAAVTVLAILLKGQLNGDVLFNFNGTVAAAVVPAVLLSVFWRPTKAIGVAVGVLVALLVGAPLSWWANVGFHVNGNSEMLNWVIASLLGTPAICAIVVLGVSIALKGKE